MFTFYLELVQQGQELNGVILVQLSPQYLPNLSYNLSQEGSKSEGRGFFKKINNLKQHVSCLYNDNNLL